MAKTEITYCDDYEAITGKKIPDATSEDVPDPEAPVVETKVIAPPEAAEVAPATVAETK